MVDQYVIPHPEGWAVRAVTSRQVTEIFQTKDEAIDYARELAEQQQSALFVKDADGSTTQEGDFRPTSMRLENHSVLIDNAYRERSG